MKLDPPGPKPARKPTRLSDYQPPGFSIPEAELDFELDWERTIVTNRMRVLRGSGANELELDGEQLELLEIRLNGQKLSEADYELDEKSLSIPGLPSECWLEVRTAISPKANTALEGLYASGGLLCTQNEPEGFRRITYFIDRPDNLARFRVRLSAKQEDFPVLLANGNAVERRKLSDGRHSVTWEDPHPKPTYLFALVAGDLACVADRFRTRSSRDVKLEIYVEAGNEPRAAYAMQALKDAMRWDEQRFGLEYDLDVYMIVAVSDFNMGAMENKGLNLFNAKLVLADPATATDDTFEFIQGVIGHEYFHNWTGNRVTCRDWFQLTLKEGLTVYRDQLFSADLNEAAVKRIRDVRHLREFQFPEDAGPMAHPIQPQEYLEINNFYTMTVYEKGAEVIRMIATLIGEQAFRQGMDLYFKRHDGSAVTTEQFVSAMEDASGTDLTQFRRWYIQKGTPVVSCSQAYDANSGTLTLTLTQNQTDFDRQPEAPWLEIPIRLGFLDENGKQLRPEIASDALLRGPESDGSYLVSLREEHLRLHLKGLQTRPIVSALRGFSAPVILKQDLDRRDRAVLLAHDPDLFNRWEAGQHLYRETIDLFLQQTQSEVDEVLSAAFGSLLGAPLDPAFLSLAIEVPSLRELTADQNPARFDETHQARRRLRRCLATAHRELLLNLYTKLQTESAADERVARGNRRLKNVCLHYLMELDEPAVDTLAWEQFQNANNLTDSLAALSGLTESESPRRSEALQIFRERWQHDSLVIDHWFAVQALCTRADTARVVRELQNDPLFSLTNPNKVRSLFGAFTRNALRFNAADGSGYTLIAGKVRALDDINPSIAAHLMNSFTHAARLDRQRKDHARTAIESVLQEQGLSNAVFEVADRCRRATEA